MNEADQETRDGYNRYMLETLQLEYERSQEMRDIVQAQNMCDEHTTANATQVAADPTMTGDSHAVKPLGRPVSYKSGVSSMGYDEYIGTFLCYRCDEEAEYGGLCEEHYDQWLDEKAEEERLDYEEWVDDLWDAEELERAQHEEEERRDDH